MPVRPEFCSDQLIAADCCKMVNRSQAGPRFTKLQVHKLHVQTGYTCVNSFIKFKLENDLSQFSPVYTNEPRQRP